ALVVLGGVVVWLTRPSNDAPPAADPTTTAPVTGTGSPTWSTSVTPTTTEITTETTESTDETDADLADVRDCIKVNSASATDADVERVDCSSPHAVYKVGKVIYGSTTGDCPSDSYSKYTHSGGYSIDLALCLMLNAKTGDCFSNITSSSGATDKV